MIADILNLGFDVSINGRTQPLLLLFYQTTDNKLKYHVTRVLEHTTNDYYAIGRKFRLKRDMFCKDWNFDIYLKTGKCININININSYYRMDLKALQGVRIKNTNELPLSISYDNIAYVKYCIRNSILILDDSVLRSI